MRHNSSEHPAATQLTIKSCNEHLQAVAKTRQNVPTLYRHTTCVAATLKDDVLSKPDFRKGLFEQTWAIYQQRNCLVSLLS